MTDGKKLKNRRTRMEMIEAVRAADRLMASGIPFTIALRECNLNRSNYQFNKSLLLGEAAMSRDHEPNPNRESQQERMGIMNEKPEKPPQAPQAWECPRCGQINAMWKGSCDCHRR